MNAAYTKATPADAGPDAGGAYTGGHQVGGDRVAADRLGSYYNPTSRFQGADVKDSNSIVVHRPHTRSEARRDTVRDLARFIERITLEVD